MNSQEICRTLGESGCYFLSLLHLAKTDYAALTLFRLAVKRGIISEDCFVKDPAALMTLATGGKWEVRHEAVDYRTVQNEMEILIYERKVTGATYAHFVVGDGAGHVAYDPLGNSRTVAEGQLVSKRIVKRLDV